MRLEISRRADLAVRALLAVDRAPERIKADVLAGELGTTAGFVLHVVRPLVLRGWLRSEPGPRGGYSLAVALDEMSVLEVIEAVDGPTDLGRCVVADGPCGRAPHCALHTAWARAREELMTHLGAQTMSSLAVSAGAGAPAR
jgi:Rrf2 family transcriptional regulator, iron-sulfur cluster assembly transcription factor